MVKEGTKAPDFSLPDQDEVERSLKDFDGSRVVIFFYPKASTGG